MTLAAYELPFDNIETQVMAWVEEALELRHGVANDPQGALRDAPDETIEDVISLLRRVRMRADRVDELLSKATLIRGRAKRAKDEAQFAAETALYTATQQRAARRAEFTSAKYVEADAKLDSFEERRIAHQADKLVNTTSNAYEVINQIAWQFNAIRSDLRARLNALQFDAVL